MMVKGMTETVRPKFSAMMAAYPTGEAQDVLQKIGGKVEANNFKNSCSIRVSRSLNYAGHSVEYIPPNLTVSGKDGKWYIYRVKTLTKYLHEKFGEPDITIHKKPYQEHLTGKRGIIVFEVDAWRDASGHATLWNGIACSDKCYFPLTKKVMLWELE